MIQINGSSLTAICYGDIHAKGDAITDRLQQIYSRLTEIICEHQPHAAAIEKVFMHQNVLSALKLGQARGAALVALGVNGFDCAEYSPREIKQAVVGYGAASKNQVQHMIQQLLRLTKPPTADAADALAVAICHANRLPLMRKLAAVTE